MALKICRACGKDVAEEAKTCPHCGIDKPGYDGFARFLSAIPGVIGAGVLLWFVSSVFGPSNHEQTAVADASPSAERACSAADVEIVKAKTRADEADYIHLTGIARNNCRKPAIVRLLWVAKDKAGVIAFTETVYVNDGHPLPAGESANFEDLHHLNPSVSGTWTIDVEGVSS